MSRISPENVIISDLIGQSVDIFATKSSKKKYNPSILEILSEKYSDTDYTDEYLATI